MEGPNTRLYWPIWRVVLREKATLAEIETSWDLADVADANEALDVADDVEAWRRSVERAEAEADSRARSVLGGMG